MTSSRTSEVFHDRVDVTGLRAAGEEKVCQRRSVGEGPSKKVYQRRSTEEDPSEKLEKVRQTRSNKEVSIKDVRISTKEVPTERGFASRLSEKWL